MAGRRVGKKCQVGYRPRVAFLKFRVPQYTNIVYTRRNLFGRRYEEARRPLNASGYFFVYRRPCRHKTLYRRDIKTHNVKGVVRMITQLDALHTVSDKLAISYNSGKGNVGKGNPIMIPKKGTEIPEAVTVSKTEDRPKGIGRERNKPNFTLMAKALLELYREERRTTVE